MCQKNANFCFAFNDLNQQSYFAAVVSKLKSCCHLICAQGLRSKKLKRHKYIVMSEIWKGLKTGCNFAPRLRENCPQSKLCCCAHPTSLLDKTILYIRKRSFHMKWSSLIVQVMDSWDHKSVWKPDRDLGVQKPDEFGFQM